MLVLVVAQDVNISGRMGSVDKGVGNSISVQMSAITSNGETERGSCDVFGRGDGRR